ncbi:hypothetical protein BJ973_007336 [Actinoplanes tereljensis]|uniref:Uncharacterized protein n=1 Tax=Paractinoplanes tereljensis TaxID=571912 RepID=A0A919NW91_9ACTN|nr:hypothetical protein [Actinoplanes tereljensis]GIF25079.1 hypothetical protein Ate02nite_78090 [Actinoplanes tereljensis]
MAESEVEDVPAEPEGDEASTRRPPDEDKDDGPGRSDRSTKKIAEVVNNFTGMVMAGTIGMGDGRGGRTAAPRVLTGRLDDDEVKAETEFYSRPVTFDEALGRLISDHVVLLCGPTGVGKRTGGINLLREVTTDRLVVISAGDLKELSRTDYRPGQGYLVVNRVDDSRVDDVDFAWRRVRDRVRRCRAYLVITTVAAIDPHVELVGQIAWNRPDMRTLAGSYLVDQDIEPEAIELVGDRLPPDCSMADVAAVLRSIRGGEEPEAAIDKLSERSAQRVRDWFDKHESDARAIVDVATLAFLGEVIYREFESLRKGFEAALHRHEAIKPPRTRSGRPKGAEPGEHVLAGRNRLICDDGLIVERQVAGPTSTRRVLGFRSDGYRRHVLAELSRRCQTPFWNAVADWLTELVVSDADSEIAFGLADLAACDFDEVQMTYLSPWSRGKIGPTGQVTAVFVLWAMCFRDDTQPSALRIANYWANHGDPEQRWSAAMAYSGVLGASDPAQAIRQLWQLIVSATKGFDQACRAMAVLFDTLLETGFSGKVLSTLDQQLHREPTRPADRNAVLRARHVLVEVLIMRENRPRVPATFLYLEKYPHRLELVARLWAEGIRYRPGRPLVLDALWHGLNRLGHITDEPIEFASRLGEALVKALPADEVTPFYQHLRTVDATTRTRAKGQRSPALVLLDVIERHYRRKAS